MTQEATVIIYDGDCIFCQNYARLAALKTKYDPTNLFRVNQNIKPMK